MKLSRFFLCVFIFIALMMTGCTNKSKQYEQSTISVLGTGTVYVQPDMVQLNISLSRVARTTRLAQEEVSVMARQVLSILKAAGIEDKNIRTASLSFRSEYDYRGNSRVLLGQRAEQSLTFSIEDINNDGERVSRIIDQLIEINGIVLNYINFNIKNNTEYFIKSRELAFEKALEKAEQYAKLSNLKIIKVLTISEEGIQQPLYGNRLMNQASLAESYRMEDSSTVLPTGELEVTTRILVVFILE